VSWRKRDRLVEKFSRLFCPSLAQVPH
jgi:hypothetical protein